MGIIGLPAVAIVAIVIYGFLGALGRRETVKRVSRAFWGTAALTLFADPLVGVIL